VSRFTHTLSALFISAVAAFAQTAEPSELSLEDNINTPVIASKQHKTIADKAGRLASALRSHGMKTSTLRNGEVVLATLPCDTIFAANSTTPKPEAMKRLSALREVVAQPARYKLLVAVHADDTGDDAYSDSLTEERAGAIDDLLWQLADNDDTNIVIYGLGKDEPLNDNTTRRERRANRRVEFYIVPLPLKL
jgi:outer membrane protein OmpA-like peptidoglycan-associated protein